MSSSVRFGVIGVLLTAIVAIGLIIFTMMQPSLPLHASSAAADQPLTVSYLVAARPLPAGTLARDTDFRVKTVPVGQLPPDVYNDSADSRSSLRGSLIRTYIDTGMPITSGDVLRPRDRGFVAAVLQDGYRAISVGVDQVSGVAGLIWPGDHVDLLLTQTMQAQFLTEIVLIDARVIAIDQEMVQGASGTNPAAGRVVRTVTLEVTPAQAQKVAVAESMGKLSLDIRPAIGTKPSPVPFVTSSLDISPLMPAKPAPKSVTVYNGKDVTQAQFQ